MYASYRTNSRMRLLPYYNQVSSTLLLLLLLSTKISQLVRRQNHVSLCHNKKLRKKKQAYKYNTRNFLFQPKPLSTSRK